MEKNIPLTQEMVERAMARVLHDSGLHEGVYTALLNTDEQSAGLFITQEERDRREGILTQSEDPLQRKGMEHGLETMDAVIRQALAFHLGRELEAEKYRQSGEPIPFTHEIPFNLPSTEDN